MRKKVFSLMLAVFLLFGLLAGCSGAGRGSDAGSSAFSTGATQHDRKDDTGAANQQYSSDEPMMPGENTGEMETALQGTPADSARKIIRNAEFSMETLDYDHTVQAIADLVEQSGGYVENSQTVGAGAAGDYVRSRWASFTVRIPAEGLDGFADALRQCGSVTSSNLSTQEVTEYYYDTEAHLKSLQLQEERLLEILSKADVLTDVIALEGSLADVRYQIESLQGSLRRLDSLIALSTVTISVQEVGEYSPEQGTPRSLGDRIAAEFNRSLSAIRRTVDNLIVLLLGNILFIAFWAAIIVTVVLVVRSRVRRKKAAPPAPGEKPGDKTEP